MATTTILSPDAPTETSSVDGIAFFDGDASWGTATSGAGDGANDTATSGSLIQISSTSTTDQWKNIFRACLLYDGSSINSLDEINSATLDIFVNTKSDTFAPAIGGTFNIYESGPATNTAVVAGDYNSLGTTELATGITYASILTGQINTWTLNASGLSLIATATAGDGIIKLGARESTYDVADSSPTWSTGHDMTIDVDWAGGSNVSELTIIHGGGATVTTLSLLHVG